MRTRFVGAAWRTAQIEIVKGTIAMIGMERRHSSHWSPTIMLSQRERGADPGLMAARATMTKNGKATKKGEILRSPPGARELHRAKQRESHDREGESKLEREKKERAGDYQVGAEAKTDHRPSATIEPATSESQSGRTTALRSTGSRSVLRSAIRSSVFMSAVPSRSRRRAVWARAGRSMRAWKYRCLLFWQRRAG